MPLITLTAQQAQSNLRRDRLGLWPTNPRDQARLQGVASVSFTPSFMLEPGEAIFTVGSCFARNIEARLASLGFELPTLGMELEVAERSSTGEGNANNILNKYTPLTILNEFRWALEPGALYPEAAYLQASEELWSDPQAFPQLTPAPLERVKQRRTEMEDLYRQLRRCRVVIVTLGLVENWFDRTTGLYLNGTPPKFALALEPDRFEVHLLSVEEIVGALEGVHALLKRYGHPDFRMLLTVSPVPLNATLRGGDVITANSYSKSALRAAAEAFVLAHAEVDYLPSYEIVTHTERSLAFADDCRHAAPPVVARIVDLMVERYVPGAEEAASAPERGLDPSQIRAAVATCIRRGNFDKAAKFLARLDGGGWDAAGYGEFEYRLERGRVLAQGERHLEAEAELSRALELQPDSVIALLGLARSSRRLGRRRQSETCMARAAELRPNDANIRYMLAGDIARDGRLSQAVDQLNACLALEPGHERARDLLADCERRLGGDWMSVDEEAAAETPAPARAPSDGRGVSSLIGRLIGRPKGRPAA